MVSFYDPRFTIDYSELKKPEATDLLLRKDKQICELQTELKETDANLKLTTKRLARSTVKLDHTVDIHSLQALTAYMLKADTKETTASHMMARLGRIKSGKMTGARAQALSKWFPSFVAELNKNGHNVAKTLQYLEQFPQLTV